MNTDQNVSILTTRTFYDDLNPVSWDNGFYTLYLRRSLVTALSLSLSHNTRHCLPWRSHWDNTRLNVEPKMNRLSECDVKGVKVDQGVISVDTVVGQNPSGTVHIDCNSVRVCGRGDRCLSPIVIGRISFVAGAFETPRLVAVSKHATDAFSFPFDSSVTQCYKNVFCPINLPEMSASKSRSEQQLRNQLESVRVIRIRRKRTHFHHRPVVVVQLQCSVHCVWIYFQFTRIW